jgi:hypothetical protein
MNRFALATVTAFAIVSGATTLAHAQATRTWVSGVGDDANPCSRTAPCKTFAGAISKTAASGEISALDPSGFGAVTITKPITISGDGTLAGILASSGSNAITVNVLNGTPTDKVVLRNLSLAGAGTGMNGVRFLSGANLIIENCTIYGFTVNDIDVALTGSGNLIVRDTTMTGGAKGVNVFGTLGTVTASLDHVSVRGTATAIDGQFGVTSVTGSLLTGSSAFGALAEGLATVAIDNSVLTFNAVAVQANVGATARASNNDIHDNQSGWGCGGGTLASAGNNRKANVGGGCPPNASITLQ